MGRSLGCDYEDSLETYNIISQMKKLKPTELKNLFEAMVNSLTIPTKEGLVFLVWEGLEPHERDLFNFPSNDIYSESIKDSYLEIFQHNQPLSSIWNNNDVLRRNRIRNRNNISSEDDFEAYTRRRLDFNSIIDQLFDTSVGLNITPGSWSSLSSSSSESESSTSSSSTSATNSANNSNNNSDNENEADNGHTDHHNASNRQRIHRHPPGFTRRQLMRRYDRMSSPSFSIPTSISNSTYPYYQRIRMSSSSSNSRRPASSSSSSNNNNNNNNNSGVMNTRFVSTERRTMTVNNNDIRTFHIISRNHNRSQDGLNNSNSNDNATTATATTNTNTNDNNNNNNNNNENNNNNNNSNNNNNNNNDGSINENRYLQRRRHHRHGNNETDDSPNTINFSSSSADEATSNYIYTTSSEPRNMVRVSSGINLNIFENSNSSSSNNNILNNNNSNNGGSSNSSINSNININDNPNGTSPFTPHTESALPTFDRTTTTNS